MPRFLVTFIAPNFRLLEIIREGTWLRKETRRRSRKCAGFEPGTDIRQIRRRIQLKVRPSRRSPSNEEKRTALADDGFASFFFSFLLRYVALRSRTNGTKKITWRFSLFYYHPPINREIKWNVLREMNYYRENKRAINLAIIKKSNKVINYLTGLLWRCPNRLFLLSRWSFCYIFMTLVRI